MNRRKLLGLLLVPIAIITALTGTPGGRSTPATSPAVQTVSALSVRAAPAPSSVAYLSATYRISARQAERRVELDTNSGALNRALAAQLPDSYAGAWLDQAHGKIVITGTDPAALRRAARRLLPADELRVRAVPRSGKQLQQMRDAVAQELGGEAVASVDVAANDVAVWTSQPARVSRTLHALGFGAAVAVHYEEPTQPTICPFDCEAPWRAGVSIDIADASNRALDACTSGFNLQDETGKLYATTAGHCFAGNPAAVAALHHGSRVALRDNNLTMYSGAVSPKTTALLDYAIMPFDPANEAHWMPPDERHYTGYVNCVQPSPQTCFDNIAKPRFNFWDVKNYSDMLVGNIVCLSGASPLTQVVSAGTRCGEITDLRQGSIVTNICAKAGDSGGALFNEVTHTAFGLQSQVSATSSNVGPCKPPAQQTSYATPVSAILTNAATRVPHTFSVITDPHVN